METIREAVCRNFNRLIENSPLSKRAIAHEMGVSEATLQRWKSGESYPEPANQEKLAEVLGVSPLELYAKAGEGASPLRGIHRAIASVPLKIYELAQDIPANDTVWGGVINLLSIAVASNAKASERGPTKEA